VVRDARRVAYHINLAGVKKLELIVEQTEEGKHNAWGLWLDPMLSR